MSLENYLKDEQQAPFEVVWDEAKYNLPNLNSLDWRAILNLAEWYEANQIFRMLSDVSWPHGLGLPWDNFLEVMSRNQLIHLLEDWFSSAGLAMNEVFGMVEWISENDREFSYDLRHLLGMDGLSEFMTLPLIDACDIFVMIVSSETRAWSWAKFNKYELPMSTDAIVSADVVMAWTGKRHSRLVKSSDKMKMLP